MGMTEPKVDSNELIFEDYDPQSWLVQAIAVLDAINMGELFSALPPEDDDRLRHGAGVSLLDMLGHHLKIQLVLCRNGSIVEGLDARPSL